MNPTEAGRNIKLLLADVDGTLVTKEKVLTPRAIQAVKDLKAKGIKFAVTSGRPPRGMGMLVEPLALETPLAGFNGGFFVNPYLTPIEEHTLEPHLAKKALEIILGNKLDCWVYRGADWYIRDKDVPHAAREEHTVQFPPTLTQELMSLLDKAVKIVGVSDDHDLMAKMEKEMQDAIGKDASAALSQPYYLDITHHDANKGTVFAFLARRFNLKPEEIATIGDMPNDVVMFKPAGLSIAMGNASDEVKAQATTTTDSYENDGFAKAVETYLLGKAQ